MEGRGGEGRGGKGGRHGRCGVECYTKNYRRDFGACDYVEGMHSVIWFCGHVALISMYREVVKGMYREAKLVYAECGKREGNLCAERQEESTKQWSRKPATKLKLQAMQS